MSFNLLISPNEEIKFIGSYDKNIINFQPIAGYPGGNAGIPAKITGLCGPSFISVNVVSTNSGLLGSPNYADETYSMVTYPENKNLPKLGAVIWSGTYREILLGDVITAPSIQEFPVTGSLGIYSDVNRVIIDYNNDVRVIYFIGPKM